jgi:hypothetical protein
VPHLDDGSASGEGFLLLLLLLLLASNRMFPDSRATSVVTISSGPSEGVCSRNRAGGTSTAKLRLKSRLETAAGGQQPEWLRPQSRVSPDRQGIKVASPCMAARGTTSMKCFTGKSAE